MGLGDGVLSSGLGMFRRVAIIAVQRFPVLKLYLGLGDLFKGGLSVLLHGPLARARHSQLCTVEQVLMGRYPRWKEARVSLHDL